MNKLIRRLAMAFVGISMAVGVGVAVGASRRIVVPVHATTAYESVASISAGDVVIFAYESGSTRKELTGVTTSGTTIGTATDYTNAGSPNATFPLTVVAGSDTGSYAFKTSSNTYLSWSSGNSLTTVASVTNASSWTLPASPTAGSIKLTNVGTTSRIMQYNASNPRWACYGNSGQTGFIIYKQVDVEEGIVTGVSLDKSFEPVKLGSTLSLTATVAPDDATNKNVTWSSSNESVATVNNGVVTPVAKGNATITVTTEDQGKTATCVVVVTDHAGTSADPLTTSDAVLVQTAAKGTTASKYYVTGDVTEISITSGGSCSGKITDGTTEISLYNIYDEGDSSSSKFSDTSKIIVTDTIVVYSVIGKYNSTVQVQYGNLYSVTRNITLASVEIRGSVTNVQYVNQNWDVSELTVWAIYSNDDEVEITAQVSLVCNPVKPTSTGSQTFTVDATYDDVAATQRSFTLTVQAAVVSVSDVITGSDLEATGTTYADFSGVTKTSKAVYAGNSALNSSTNIQLRSKNSNSGIISTRSGGKRVKSVSIGVASGSPSVSVYGSNTAYTGTDASVLYGDNKGTLVATLTSSTTSVIFQSDYKYVGVCSSGGAIYLSSVTIEWEQYSAEDVASEIKTMAGGWTNDTSTSSCGDHYRTAKEMILTLSDTELANFTSDSASEDIKSAKATYEHWCSVNNDASPYSGTIVSPAARTADSLLSEVNGSATLVIIVISTVSLVAVGGYFVIRRRKENN